MRRLLLVLLAVLASRPSSVWAESLALGGPFSDHMVLQRDIPVRIWGTATPGSEVSVKLDQNQSVAKAEADGSWQLELPACGPTRPNESKTLEVSSGAEKLLLSDVVVGDVWLCAGQSNMRYTLGRREDNEDPQGRRIFADDLEKASHPEVRLLSVSMGEERTPVGRKWARCEPSTAVGFSAIGYFFGEAMNGRNGVPVGLIDLGKGGQSLRAFLPAELVETDPRLARLKSPDPEKKPGSVYAKDVRWLAPYALRGVLWYQGESDITRAQEYPAMLRVMVDRWRSDFRQPELPFFVVELPGYLGKENDPEDQRVQAKWRPIFREAQARFVAETPAAFLAKASDLGEPHEIHPRDKKPLAARLVNAVEKSGIFSPKNKPSAP